ncbi:hypothetical protein OHW21_14805 [Acinetobacter baumannii]|uniref:hypothetical protein n=1 Tax=Acinetobacter baumannii TaxID=470 RepID=UPI001C0BFA8B|nr:hypothetical protein [Acinetobacter baumannii]MBU3079757.1 hypothetical protein [Acinetobacter baumannii]MDC5036688.1 hypothetical protein [Acinetobacter baumannii]MDC5230730.1 hypothetical protein [Acinetobacter baumannii]
MTTEIFKARTQYNDFMGTSAAETQGFSEYLESKNLIENDEFVVGIDFSPMVSILKEKNEVLVNVYLVKNFKYEEYETKARFEDVLEVRKIEVYVDIIHFFSLFKRMNVSFSWQGLLENKEINF